MNHLKPTLIHLLYSQTDQTLAAQVCPYLREFQHQGFIDQYEEVIVEELAVSGLEKQQLKKSRALFFILATPAFLSSPFVRSSLFQDLLTRHNLKRNQIIPIFFYPTANRPNPLKRLARLQNNATTLIYHSQSDLHQQLIPIFKELEPIPGNWRQHNQAIDDAWQLARTEKDYDQYLYFQKTYPHSVYSEKAKSILEELVEEKLWKEAVSFDQMKYYYEYLASAPLKKYEDACIKKIQEIESRQDTAQLDALKNKNIALALDFKGRFDRKAYAPDVDQHLFQLFDQEITDSPELNTEGYFLQHKAFQNSTPEEAMSLNLSLRYHQQITGRLQSVLGKLKSFQASYAFGGIACILIFCFLFFYYSLAIFHLGKINLMLFVAYIAVIFVAYRCFEGMTQASKALEKHQTLFNQIRKDYIYLQVAAVSKDQQQIQRIQFNLANTNFNLIPYEKVSMLYFIQASEALEQEQAAQGYLKTNRGLKSV